MAKASWSYRDKSDEISTVELSVADVSAGGADFDAVEQQLSPGMGYTRAEYYIDDWGTGTTNFFFTQGSNEKFNPGLGFYILFSTQREGTGVWNAIRSY